MAPTAQKLVLDWRKRQQLHAAVRVTIDEYVWQLPERGYPDAIREIKAGDLYDHVYEHYWSAGQSTYMSGRREGSQARSR